ncbi:hypothetical protein ACIBAG_00950 [Streptomyces sp. NPDC051243]|uniref:hypothetical protein n=1 Tax=Streptomyces sp. NPDC051243 TaxID=3365646 RepID=UPI00378CAEF6
MGRYDLALIGFGGVNRALTELISRSGDRLAGELDFALRVVAITDLRAGSLVDTADIDLTPLLTAEPGELSFAGLAGGSAVPRNEWVIREVPADIVVEATFTNPTDGEPTLTHVRWALESGKHVCTTDKGPVALAGRALMRLAVERGVSFEFEGSVLSGTPVLRTAEPCSAAWRSPASRTIMNGTSNYIRAEHRDLRNTGDQSARGRAQLRLPFAQFSDGANLVVQGGLLEREEATALLTLLP